MFKNLLTPHNRWDVKKNKKFRRSIKKIKVNKKFKIFLKPRRRLYRMWREGFIGRMENLRMKYKIKLSYWKKRYYIRSKRNLYNFYMKSRLVYLKKILYRHFGKVRNKRRRFIRMYYLDFYFLNLIKMNAKLNKDIEYEVLLLRDYFYKNKLKCKFIYANFTKKLLINDIIYFNIFNYFV
mgnify:CR=1 FL=1